MSSGGYHRQFRSRRFGRRKDHLRQRVMNIMNPPRGWTYNSAVRLINTNNGRPIFLDGAAVTNTMYAVHRDLVTSVLGQASATNLRERVDLFRRFSKYSMVNTSSNTAYLTVYTLRARKSIQCADTTVDSLLEILNTGWTEMGLPVTTATYINGQNPYMSHYLCENFKIEHQKTLVFAPNQRRSITVRQRSRQLSRADYFAANNTTAIYNWVPGDRLLLYRLQGELGSDNADATSTASSGVAIHIDVQHSVHWRAQNLAYSQYSVNQLNSAGTYVLDPTTVNQIGMEPDDSTEAAGFAAAAK